MDTSPETGVIYASERTFEVRQYTVSHRRLLLRSPADSQSGRARIEVHFGGVSTMLLRPYYEGLLIRHAKEAEYDEVAQISGVRADPGYLFILGEGLTSFVFSGKPQWREDHESSDAPSWYGHMLGVE